MAISLDFPIVVYSELTQINETLSRARARIFYKGANRNGTFITDDFAQDLIDSLPYVPVKGIFETDDFTDHGEKRTEGRIYGIVPADLNFAWEPHLDEDGVERVYACADVLLYTALYPEANTITGKGLSMELFPPTLKYHFEIIQGVKYAVFESGSFLGLQVLGDKVEPCFEGASFFTLQKQIEDTIERIKQFSLQKEEPMPKLNFKLSDDEKFEALWTLLNPLYSEEGGWIITTCICAVYDEYAVVMDTETGAHRRAYYEKNDETNSLQIIKEEVCFIEDITETERAVLNRLRELNGGNFELVNEKIEKVEEIYTQNADYVTKLEEKSNEISTLEMDKEKIQSDFDALNTTYTAQTAELEGLKTEVESLRTYKSDIEKQNKLAVIAEYNDKLSEEVLDTYSSNLDSYTAEELDMRLAYELKKTNFAFFKNSNAGGVLPKEQPKSGIEAFLDKYKK